jgi:hypothetical protein
MLFSKADVIEFVRAIELLEDDKLVEFLQSCAKQTDMIREVAFYVSVFLKWYHSLMQHIYH